jgi:uncharacterized repeat protein (TIGR01451 family)
MRTFSVSIILMFSFWQTVYGQTDLVIDPALAEQGSKMVAAERPALPQQQFEGAYPPRQKVVFFPPNEYLANGGDGTTGTRVKDDWTVQNFESSDTVAHFDTLSGQILVEPSNQVYLYAPRFCAVRKVEGLLNHGQITALSQTDGQLTLNVDKNKEQLGFAAQEMKTGYARTQTHLGGAGSRRASTGAKTVQGLIAYNNFESAMYYSNQLRQRTIGSAELANLAEGSIGARAWQGQEGIKVQINVLAPMEATAIEGAESFFQIDAEESKTSKLRLIKVASKNSAQPGEIIEFTIRFDNVGNQVIGNVTILDSLTARLEFLPDSTKSSFQSGFLVQSSGNSSNSFTLRFEITEPLKPGEFGVVQFQCRIR